MLSSQHDYVSLCGTWFVLLRLGPSAVEGDEGYEKSNEGQTPQTVDEHIHPDRT